MTSAIASETSVSSSGGMPSVTGSRPVKRVAYARPKATASMSTSVATLMDV